MSREIKPEDIKVCKVVLLGESSVGKTCIITRFIDDIFYENIMTTTGASYATKSIVYNEHKNKVIKFEIWDTAGQEKYRSLTQIFYKDASIVIFVYDITKENTFKEIKEYWYQQIKENAPQDISINYI